MSQIKIRNKADVQRIKAAYDKKFTEYIQKTPEELKEIFAKDKPRGTYLRALVDAIMYLRQSKRQDFNEKLESGETVEIKIEEPKE